jgi:hypothetical protein
MAGFMRMGRFAGVAGVLLGACQCPVALADEQTVQAHWVAREFRYTYQGFTARYSCDGLAERMKVVLLLLGARKQDLKVAPTGCTEGFGRATLFPGVSVHMSLLEPMDEKTPPGTQPVPSVWRNVDLTRPEPLHAAGDCELSEQIKQSILPRFTTRNLEYRSTCIPHQLTPGGTVLKADVLVPAPVPPAGGGAPAG